MFRSARAASLSTLALVSIIAPAIAAEDLSEEERALRFASIVDRVTVEGTRVDYSGLETSTATKTNTPLVDIPQSITLITRGLIDDQAMRSMADVVRYAPGVTMGQGEGHRDAPTLRGNSSTADFYIDGVRDDVQYFRDLYNADRIEILKGPNALIFGRGAGGGAINRVTKKADGERVRQLTLQTDTFGSGRAAVDIGGALGGDGALRLNAFYENSDSYRDFVGLERYGVNPTAAYALSPDTDFSLSYEYFNDRRDVDRGVPSVNGGPFDSDRSAFFGNPNQSYSTAENHFVIAGVEHRFSPNVTLRNKTHFGDYDKFYQNVQANSAADVNGDVSLQGYNSGTKRQNFFNQTDFVSEFSTSQVSHTLLIGGEFGWQDTENLRSDNINGGVVNVASPTIFTPVIFTGPRNDNNVDLFVASIYVQDQIEINDHIQLIGGVRFEHFDLEFFDNLTSSTFSRTDSVASPRGGIIFKPLANASLYASYSQSFLPQSGDQFSSLSASTAALEPEKFENIEIGAKWDIQPGLEAAVALYRLDRENTRALDPITSDTVLTGAQRSKGVEVSLAGAITERWQMTAGYAWQNVEITRDTASAVSGSVVPLTPEHSFSIWSKYQLTDKFAAAAGVTHAADQFTSISNNVVLPSYTRVDAALFYEVCEKLQLQLNVENLTNELYFPTAHNDNNITPGKPRSAILSLTTIF